MKIESIAISTMRNDAYFQFNTEFRDLVIKFEAEKLKIKSQFIENYLPLYTQLDDILKKIRKSAITEKIQEADALRDNMCVGINEISKAYLRHFDADVCDAAKRVRIILDTYGNIARKPLNEQTSAVYNLLQELQGKYKEDIKKIGLEEWVNQLKITNQQFDTLVKDRYDESAAKIDAVMKEVRKELDVVYKNLVDMVNVFAMIESDKEVFISFIKTLNVIIAKYATIMAQQAGKRQSKKE